jgi:hypothetical protein
MSGGSDVAARKRMGKSAPKREERTRTAEKERSGTAKRALTHPNEGRRSEAAESRSNMLFDVELIEASADNISVRWRFPAPSLELAGARPFRLPAAVRLLA